MTDPQITSTSLVIRKNKRYVIRCGRNRYQTPLLSFDDTGIYVKCRDCRRKSEDGEQVRGEFHLITWGQILRFMLGLISEEELLIHDQTSGHSPDGNTSPNEEPARVSEPGGQRD